MTPCVMREVTVAPMALDRLATLLLPDRREGLAEAVARGRAALAGRRVWNVNSTAGGGGVAEMLTTMVAYSRGGGADARWLVIEGNPEFFVLTKRIHNLLHGSPGDGGPTGPAERATYEQTLGQQVEGLTSLVQPGDVVLLHDPQTAGLAGALRDHGAHVAWRCHVGTDARNAETERGWAFLEPYVRAAPATIFTRRTYVPDWMDQDSLWLIPPSIDPLSTKNRSLPPQDVVATVQRLRIMPADARVVLQVSRWDRLKDMAGVLTGFADHLGEMPEDVHLLLAGPEPAGVSDDPESAEVRGLCDEIWSSRPAADRRRLHLASLPMDDIDENAHIVNALQHHAAVVVQKSLAEGFGLTVAEAMWKERPVVASRVGGIEDQIVDGESGLLLDDPTDLDGCMRLVREVLVDAGLAARLGVAARERVRDRFLVDRHLRQYVELFEAMMSTATG